MIGKMTPNTNHFCLSSAILKNDAKFLITFLDLRQITILPRVRQITNLPGLRKFTNLPGLRQITNLPALRQIINSLILIHILNRIYITFDNNLRLKDLAGVLN